MPTLPIAGKLKSSELKSYFYQNIFDNIVQLVELGKIWIAK